MFVIKYFQKSNYITNLLTPNLSFMKKTVLIFLLLINSLSFSQNKDSEFDDFELKERKELLVSALNNLKPKIFEGTYQYENNNLIVITKQDFDENDYKIEETQKLIMQTCFEQLHTMIKLLKHDNFIIFEDAGFQNIIFKTHVIGNEITRRYHFKFGVQELRGLPEYIDKYELYQYVVVKNKTKNIILEKNPDKF